VLLNDRVVAVVVEQADEASDNTAVVEVEVEVDADADASDDVPDYPSKDCADDADCDFDNL